LSGTLYFNTEDVRQFYAAVKDSVEIVWPLAVMEYGTVEFGIHDCDGYTLAFAEQVRVPRLTGLSHWQHFASPLLDATETTSFAMKSRRVWHTRDPCRRIDWRGSTTTWRGDLESLDKNVGSFSAGASTRDCRRQPHRRDSPAGTRRTDSVHPGRTSAHL
jgi:hypothetical protein